MTTVLPFKESYEMPTPRFFALVIFMSGKHLAKGLVEQINALSCSEENKVIEKIFRNECYRRILYVTQTAELR